MNRILLSGLALVAAFTATAQDNPFGGGTPPTAKVGTCYAKCYIPSQYETITEQVLVKAAGTNLVAVPAQYDTVTEKVLTKEETKKLVPVSAVYETVTEQVLIKEETKKLIPVAAVYETVTEKVLIKEASTRWTMKRDKNCMSADPNDCFVACYDEVPEQYTTYTSSVLKTPATVREEVIPAQYKTVSRKVVKTPATVREEVIPAQYTTITKRVVKKAATTTEKAIDAKYKTITKRKLVSAGEYSDWREVLCGDKVNVQKIRAIQQALIDNGYDVGPFGVDNVMGPASRAALMQYQRDNSLPVGNLNIETLQKLGVKY